MIWGSSQNSRLAGILFVLELRRTVLCYKNYELFPHLEESILHIFPSLFKHTTSPRCTRCTAPLKGKAVFLSHTGKGIDVARWWSLGAACTRCTVIWVSSQNSRLAGILFVLELRRTVLWYKNYKLFPLLESILHICSSLFKHTVQNVQDVQHTFEGKSMFPLSYWLGYNP